jgi:hypothetical protein
VDVIKEPSLKRNYTIKEENKTLHTTRTRFDISLIDKSGDFSRKPGDTELVTRKTMSRFMDTTRLSIKSVKTDENIPIYTITNFLKEVVKEDPRITKVREKFMKDKVKKEEEYQNKLKVEKEIMLQNRLHDAIPKGPINGSKITFDCNGKVINIKAIDHEKLAKDLVETK